MSSDWEFLDDAEPVTSDSEDSVDAGVEYSENDAERQRRRSDGADVGGDLPSTDSDTPAFAVCRWCEEAFGTRSAERLHACPQRQAHANATSAPETESVEEDVVSPRTHELGAYFAFDEAGLDPYHDVRELFEAANGRPELEPFEFDGDTWRLLEDTDDDNPPVDSWTGGLAGREEDPVDVFPEFKLKLGSDATVQRTFTVFVRPGFPEPQKEDGSPAGGIPRNLPESVRLEVRASYVDDDQVLELLQTMADALGLDPHHYREEAMYLPSCNFFQWGRYTRQLEELNRQGVTSHNGIIDRLERFSTISGGSGSRTWDDTDREGQMDAVTLSNEDWRVLLPGSSFGKRLQSYLPKHPRGDDVDAEEDPLAAPKTEIRFNTQFTEDGAVRWDERHELRDELDRSLTNSLHWGGLPVRPDPDVYVEDEYFAVDGQPADWDLRQDPTPWLEERDERIALDHYVGGDLSPAEEDVLEVFAQHGESSHQELAAESGRSTSTVYRLFRKLADAVVSDDGMFSFASDYLQNEFQSLLGLVEDSVDYAKQSIAELQAEDGVDDLGPLGRWARAHSATIDLDRVNDRFEVDFQVGQLSRVDLERILRAGVEAARDTGVHAWKRFRDGRFSWLSDDGQRKTNQKPIKNRGAVLRP